MPIVVNLDVMMAKRKISSSQLAEQIDLTLPICPFSKTTKPRRCGFPPLPGSARHWIASPATS